MAAAKYDILIEQGVDYDTPFNLSSNGVNLPLINTTFRMQIKDDQGVVIWTGTRENGKLLVNEANSTVTILITAAESALFVFDFATYDLEFVMSTGKVVRLLRGSVTLSPEVTTVS